MPTLLCALAAFFLVVHVATLVIAWWRCRPGAARPSDGRILPQITVVRPLCGIETFSGETLEASFGLDYPGHELFLCVAREDDPIVPLAQAAIARHPQVQARLLIGDDPISANPKLNNMVKAWREAAHEWIVFIDSNVLVTPDYLHRCVAAWRSDTGAVSAPPVGSRPAGMGGYLECAFLNTYEARWQYVVDALGNGFAQGKTLFYRKADLDRTGLRELASEPAEDAATTKMVRRLGQRVRLAPPSPMPIGARGLAEVWSRQLRWARLRKATFLLEFLPELISGSFVPTLCVAGAAFALDWPVLQVVGAYLAVWYAAEMAMATACGWPTGWRLALSIVLRDILLPALWVGAFTGRSFTWKGTAMQVEHRRRRPKLETLRPEESV